MFRSRIIISKIIDKIIDNIKRTISYNETTNNDFFDSNVFKNHIKENLVFIKSVIK